MAEQRLDAKVALITGSDSGIGQATAIEFAREGADVVVHYLHDDAGAEKARAAVALRDAERLSCRQTSAMNTRWRPCSTGRSTSSARSTS